ncbi:DNA polymerase alpha/epsilon subunit B-domain-containing protein [Pholiota molesta]|nr:DNA polymerase alpha/epsilon subunit B-domain-containing protein [Pholiota molesta]
MLNYLRSALPPTLSRPSTVVLPPGPKTPSFLIGPSQKSYRHQYSNIYFIRLRLLRGFVEEHARRRWETLAGASPCLEVEKGKLCYIVGTIYMDMPLKPNVMEDIARDQSIPAPPPPIKFFSSEDGIMLEDESGRIMLVGDRVKDAKLVTGVIVGALGMETPTGEFEVIDLCYPEMAPQPMETGPEEDKMDVDVQDDSSDEWIAVVSGLDIGSLSPSDAQIQLLTEYLTGEGGTVNDQVSAANISRLIIAGDSLAVIDPIITEGISTIDEKKARRYGYDATSFSAHPVLSLASTLSDIAATLPIHILPGETDPSGTIMPQQPFPRAMFGDAARYSTFSCETNPTYLTLASDTDLESSSESTRPPIKRNILINSGQPLNDMFKYLPSPPNTRLSILESTLRWRHMAPTAPDTLWCHPYFSEDPFMITETPDIYIVGGQKKFATKLVKAEHQATKQKDRESVRCRIVMVPSFAETGTLVLVNLRTLDVKRVNFAVFGMTTGGKVDIKGELLVLWQ